MRPYPPENILDYGSAPFVPAPDVWDWVSEQILNESGAIHNPDHEHLQHAHIGFIWAGTPNARRGRKVIGQAEEPVFRCGAWQKGRQEQQIIEWFGQIPDFLITLDAEYCRKCNDTEFAMLVEHELSHCAQAKDPFGAPKFNRDTGAPVFTLIDHDVSEFIGVVARYGVGDPDGNLAKLIAAANQAPSVGIANIASACGTCIRSAA